MVFTKIYHFRMLSTGSKIVRTALYDVINHDAIDKDGSRNFVRAGGPAGSTCEHRKQDLLGSNLGKAYFSFSFLSLSTFFYNCSFFLFCFNTGYFIFIFPSSPFFLFLAVGLKCCARFGDLRISSLRNDPRGTGLIKPYTTLSKELEPNARCWFCTYRVFRVFH